VRDPAGPNDIIAGTRGPLAGSTNDPARRIGIYQFYYNAASLSTRGVDLELRFRFDLGRAGQVRCESLNTYVERLSTTAAEGQPAINLLALERAPRYKGTHSGTWKLGPWGASIVANVVGSTMQPALIRGVRNNVSSWTTVDLQVTYSGLNRIAFAAGARNVLDREPPFYNADQAGYDTSTQSLVGRFFYVRLTLGYK
jgi:iron complex outermembrane receptor protein